MGVLDLSVCVYVSLCALSVCVCVCACMRAFPRVHASALRLLPLKYCRESFGVLVWFALCFPVARYGKSTEHSFLIELGNLCGTCATHVRHMCDVVFFLIALGISFLIERVTAIYENDVVEVQKR